MSFELLRNYNIISFEEIDSTNEEAKRLARAGVSGNFIITSKIQTAGVGRRMRKWESPLGNVNLTIMLEANTPVDRLYNFVFIAGISLLDSIKDLYKAWLKAFDEDKKPHDSENKLLQLKWPNDLLINGKKAAGILIESIKVQDKFFVIIGVGVNVVNHPEISEKKLCSISSELGINCCADEISEGFITKFSKYYISWKKTDDFQRVKAYWLEHAYMLGEKVSIDMGIESGYHNDPYQTQNTLLTDDKILRDKLSKVGVISGIFSGIDDTGSIILEDGSGKVSVVSFGEVI